ncbi:DUF3891 family protein [Lichenifustis flavocetrariae]|uniref:DUF3891 family protein n=1 Tax=Lichenifustis flavocetrariae TaxID=2949735 RepID=A0AA41Z1I3_9HYPH|nr:DUF3891 family protein [Lichenifustis flavocetrariae]MCW6511261.1 DUF3891 family protein [Lichenifustis flavocetrariae]
MLFNDQGSTRPPVTLAISQPAHALISGEILRAWAEPLDKQLVLAAEQHDIAWLDWEVSPTFDPRTGRPHFFRDIGAAQHAPMWEQGVRRAEAAWGRHVALLVSRHGSTIYQRFSDRHRSTGDGLAEDERAASDYLRRHRSLQDDWARALGLDADAVARDAELLAFADTLSLILCGALPAPPQIEVTGRTIKVELVPGITSTYRLSPWPFVTEQLTFAVEARALPSSGRFADESAARAWLADPARAVARSSLCAA